MRRFLSRLTEGKGALAIDPGGLPHLEIYLSGLAGLINDGGNPAVAHWNDQSGNNRNFTAGLTGGKMLFHTGQSEGLNSQVSCGGCISGASPPAPTGLFNNLLPAFIQTRGSTQYVFAQLLSPVAANGIRVAMWPQGSNGGPGLIYQGPGFSFFGGVPNGHTALQVDSTGFDLGPQPTATWNLWTIVNDTLGNMIVYLDGKLRTAFAGVTYNLTTELDLGGPSLGADVFDLIASYVLYTDTHSAATVAGVHAWFRSKYGGIA